MLTACGDYLEQPSEGIHDVWQYNATTWWGIIVQEALHQLAVEMRHEMAFIRHDFEGSFPPTLPVPLFAAHCSSHCVEAITDLVAVCVSAGVQSCLLYTSDAADDIALV